MVGAAVSCGAQQASRIGLRLTDASGAQLAGAHVLLRANQAKAVTGDVTAVAGENAGEYFANLQPGVYDVFVSAPCEVPFVTQIKVADGKPQMLRVQLDPQVDAESAYISGCPTPDDFTTQIEFNTYEPPLPDHVPLETRFDTGTKP